MITFPNKNTDAIKIRITIRMDTDIGNPNPNEKRKANPDKKESGFMDPHSKDSVDGADI